MISVYGTYSEKEIDRIKERIKNVLRDVEDGNGGLLPESIKEFLKQLSIGETL